LINAAASVTESPHDPAYSELHERILIGIGIDPRVEGVEPVLNFPRVELLIGHMIGEARMVRYLASTPFAAQAAMVSFIAASYTL